jgi:hypothetical protein
VQCEDAKGKVGLDREFGNCWVSGHEEKGQRTLHVKQKRINNIQF